MSRVQRYTILALAAASAAAVILVSCQTTNPMYNPNKSHHTVEGFRNNYSTGPRGSFWKWQRERWEKGLPKVPEGGYHFEQLRPDVAWLKANRVEPTLTWIGHASREAIAGDTDNIYYALIALGLLAAMLMLPRFIKRMRKT